MEININRKELLKAISKAEVISRGKHTLAILSSILLVAKDNVLEISATNLESAFHGIYSAKVIKPGRIVVSSKFLLDFIRKSKSQEISIIEKESQWVNISDGVTSLNFVCPSVDDFPLLPKTEEIKEMAQFSIDLFDFKEMIDAIVIISASDDKRPHKEGGYFQIIEKNFRAVSTDGSRLVLIDREIITGNNYESEININGILIPKRELEKLCGIFLKESKQKDHGYGGFGLFEKSKNDILLSTDQNYFAVRKQNESVVIRLLEGGFPDYKDIIKDRGNNIFVDRKELLEVMRKMMIMQDESHRGVSMNIESENMKIAFVNPDIGEMMEEIKIKYGGASIKIAMNPIFFVDFLQFMKSDKIKLDVKDAESFCIITGDQDGGFIGVIMAMAMRM